MSDIIEHPAYRPRAGRWCVFVTDYGVKGCTGSFRWRWRARMQAHSNHRFWPSETRIIEIEFMPHNGGGQSDG